MRTSLLLYFAIPVWWKKWIQVDVELKEFSIHKTKYPAWGAEKWRP